MSMTKKLLTVGLIALGLVSLSGCLSIHTPAAGMIWTDVKFGDTATTATGNKTGKACAQAWFGIVAFGDASIEAAKAAGGITTISYVDHTAKHMVVFGEYCTIVKGS